jgi:GT2 family glycosyltransferase
MKLFAVISTHNRHDLVYNLTRSLSVDGITPIVIDNASDPPLTEYFGVKYIDSEQPPNLSRLWNRGLDAACELYSGEDGEFGIAVLNDDLVTYPGFVRELAGGLREDAAVVHPAGVIGCAYVLRGSLVRIGELRFDERFRWWYGDNDLEWQARQLGGLRAVELSGTLQHLYPNKQTRERADLTRQAELDREAFLEKRGRLVW